MDLDELEATVARILIFLAKVIFLAFCFYTFFTKGLVVLLLALGFILLVCLPISWATNKIYDKWPGRLAS